MFKITDRIRNRKRELVRRHLSPETYTDEPLQTSSSDEGSRSIKLEIQIGPASQSLTNKMDQDVKTISDLVDKVRHLVPELRDVEDIEVYQDECLLPQEEKVDVINTKEVVVIKAEAEGGAPKKARLSRFLPSTSWQSLPDVVFRDVMMMAGLNNLHDFHKCRQMCRSWNVMTTQMTKREKDTIRRQAERLAAEIRDQIINLPSVITTVASLAHHGFLNSVYKMLLWDVDLASVPAENLASLASCATMSVNLSNVSNCDIISLLDSVECKYLYISNQSLSRKETRALVRAMETRVECVVLGMWGEVSLDIRSLTQYSGQGRCEEVMCYDDTADRYGEELRTWVNWKVSVRNDQIKVERINLTKKMLLNWKVTAGNNRIRIERIN